MVMFLHKCDTNVEITWLSAWFLVSFIPQLYCDVLDLCNKCIFYFTIWFYWGDQDNEIHVGTRRFWLQHNIY